MSSDLAKGDTIISFRDKVSSFVTGLHLSWEDEESLTAEIVRFVLQITSKARSRNLRKLGFKLNCLSDVVYFKDQYLNSSSYLNRVLWEAVLLYITKKQKPKNRIVYADISFCLNWLSEENLAAFKLQRTDERLSVDKIDLTKWSNGKFKNIEDYARSKIHKLNFLSLYDPSMDLEDFVQDILCEFVRIFNSYPRSKGKIVDEEPIEQRVCKYIDKALGNKIKTMIDYYTSASRRRITSTQDRKYKKIKALKKKNGKNGRDPDSGYEAEIAKLKESIRQNQEDYYPTTTELNMNLNTDEEEVKLNIESSYYNDQYSTESTIDHVWINELDETIKDKRTLDYCMALLGRDNDFEEWIDKNATPRDKKNINNSRYGTICKLAKNYVSLKYKNGEYGEVKYGDKWKPNEIRYQEDVLRCFA